MLVRLDFGPSDDRFFQSGESVTVGNFIWTPYTTMTMDDYYQYFGDGRNGYAESYVDNDQKNPKSWMSKYFAIYVECKPIDPTLSFECVADIEIIEYGYHGRDSQTYRNHKINDIETKSNISREYCNGYSKARDYKVCVNVKSFEIFPPKCFTSPKSNLTDIELIVGDKTFYASKHILAQHSKKFYEMIYKGNQSVDQLEITDVSPEDFLLFLEVLYDCEKGVRWSSIEKIADLSILYESPICLRKCEIFLIRQNVFQRDRRRSFEFDEQEKIAMQYCQKYGFKTFFRQIVQSLTANKIRDALENTEEYSIGEELKEALSARLAEFEAEASNVNRQEPKKDNIKKFMAMIDQAPIDFNHPRDNLTDIVLSVGDKKFHVNKQILANAYAYFYAMFYGNFNEKNEDVIELKDVDQDEFDEFLQHVYNSDRNHNDTNIEFLTKLCHFFDASYNLRQCQKYILNSDSFNDAQKIYMARKYHLTYLFDQVVFKYQDMDDLKKFTLMEDFDKLDKVTFADITMKILENHTGSKTVNRS